MRLAVALYQFWYIRCYYSEAHSWLVSLLSRSTTRESTVVRARALVMAGTLARVQFDQMAARAFYEESVMISRQLGARSELAYALRALANLTREEGDVAQTAALLEESLALFTKLCDKRGRAMTLFSMGLLAMHQGDDVQAAARYEENLILFHELGDKHGIAMTLNNLGEIARSQGDYPQAAANYARSLALCQELRDPEGCALALINLGYAVHSQGDHTGAEALFAQSIILYREVGNRPMIIWGLAGLAGSAVAAGRLQRSARLLGVVEAALDTSGEPMQSNDRADYERNLAATRAQLDDAAFAAAWAAGRALPLEQAIAEALNR
jgi:non-specific serine/threonine protein kinase